MSFDALSITTSCRGYGKYLTEWADSIIRQTVKPGVVCLFTHGSVAEGKVGSAIVERLKSAAIPALHGHTDAALDFGTARNRAIAMAPTEWAMHLDADDTLFPYAVEEFACIAPFADVISAGYERSGVLQSGPSKRARIYRGAVGTDALNLSAICSGNSPFRKSFWEQVPYRTDMLGAWDTALWIKFAHLGARFVPTPRPVFYYRQHSDSVFNRRRKTLGWARVHTTAMLRNVRANRSGVDIIVPRDGSRKPDRQMVWDRVVAHYATHHADWPIREGYCAPPTWIKGAAIADALKSSNADVIIIADADCMVDPDALRASVSAIQRGAPWAMPHTDVYRAPEDMLSHYLLGDPRGSVICPDSHSTERPPYEGAPGGGIVVLRRVNYDAIGGIPLAFRGWGSEDRALATLCDGLLGPCHRGTADLLHLWHEPQADRGRPNANLQLLRRLGVARIQGQDALTAAVYTMPNPKRDAPVRDTTTWRTHHGTARPAVPVQPIDLDAVLRRQALLRQRKRRAK